MADKNTQDGSGNAQDGSSINYGASVKFSGGNGGESLKPLLIMNLAGVAVLSIVVLVMAVVLAHDHKTTASYIDHGTKIAELEKQLAAMEMYKILDSGLATVNSAPPLVVGSQDYSIYMPGANVKRQGFTGFELSRDDLKRIFENADSMAQDSTGEKKQARDINPSDGPPSIMINKERNV